MQNQTIVIPDAGVDIKEIYDDLTYNAGFSSIIVDGIKLPIDPPVSYDSKLPDFRRDFETLISSTEEDIEDYFSSIRTCSLNIRYINGVELKTMNTSVKLMHCDHCRVSEDLWMWYCKACEKNMCRLCYKERNEKIAMTYGSVNWRKREQGLKACFEHERQGHMTSKEVHINRIRCNICDCYSELCPGYWVCNRKLDLDICLECASTDKGLVMLQMYPRDFQWVKITDRINNDIGSLFDWAPLLIDEDSTNAILYNINKDSEHYHKACIILCGDYYNMFIYDSLETVLQRVVDIEDREDEEVEASVLSEIVSEDDGVVY